MSDLILYVWGSEEKNSSLALDLARQISSDHIHIVDVKQLTLQELPKWLDGVPTIVDQSAESPEVYYGARALELLTERKGAVPPPQQLRSREAHFGEDMPQHLRYIRPSLPDHAEDQQSQPYDPLQQSQPHQPQQPQGAAFVFGKSMDVLETNQNPRLLDAADDDRSTMSQSDMQANIEAIMKRRQALFKK